jgi:hypothetical protein
MGTSCRDLNWVVSGERGGGLGLRFGAVLGSLSVGRAYVRKWPVMARRYEILQVLHVWA